jgi:hypothetical protein
MAITKYSNAAALNLSFLPFRKYRFACIGRGGKGIVPHPAHPYRDFWNFPRSLYIQYTYESGVSEVPSSPLNLVQPRSSQSLSKRTARQAGLGRYLYVTPTTWYVYPAFQLSTVPTHLVNHLIVNFMVHFVPRPVDL